MAEAFVDRLREATVDPADMDMGALLGAARAASTALDKSRGLNLVRIVYARSVSLDAEADLRGRLNSKGDVIGPAGQDQLLKVLAACALIEAFSRTQHSIAQVAAFAVRCAEHAGWRAVHPDVADHAAAYLAQRSVVVRARQSDTPDPSQGESAQGEGSLERFEQELKALRGLVRHDRTLGAERDDLLWWVLSGAGSSNALEAAQALVSRLRLLPEPPSTDELLKARLDREPSTSRTDGPSPPAVPDELHDLCDGLINTDPGARSPEEARTLLDQLLLIRAYESTGK